MTDLHQQFRVVADDRPTSTQKGWVVSSMLRAANLVYSTRARGTRAIMLMLLCSFAAITARPANATPPVPFYTDHVTDIDRQSAGAVVITTKDSVATVCAWYRLNLRDQNGETVTNDGAHIFHTHSGATVDVEPGNLVVPGTTIGLVWDAKKFGPYSGK
jgi:hypothetical protein